MTYILSDAGLRTTSFGISPRIGRAPFGATGGGIFGKPGGRIDGCVLGRAGDLVMGVPPPPIIPDARSLCSNAKASGVGAGTGVGVATAC